MSTIQELGAFLNRETAASAAVPATPAAAVAHEDRPTTANAGA
jgi:hypothetical protein